MSVKKILLLVSLVLLTNLALAQSTYMRGRPVFPAFEGWRQNDDGSINFLFGYMNENWEEEPFMPVGENNFFTPGDADQGQPTNFFPRRNRFVFEVTVPSDWGDRELVWTLNINGEEYTAHATTDPNYIVDNLHIASEGGSLGIGTSSPESRANVPPELTLQGEQTRSVRVGEPLTIVSHVSDDGIPRSRVQSAIPEDQLRRRMLMPPSKPTVGMCTGEKAKLASILHKLKFGKIHVPAPTLPGVCIGFHLKFQKMAW